MIVNFADQSTADVFHGIDSKSARKIPKDIWKVAARKLDMLNAAKELPDLLVPPGNRLESLKGHLHGFRSIRINDQFRIIFKWIDGQAKDVQILDYHR